MPDPLLIALAQLNPTVGDVAGNLAGFARADSRASPISSSVRELA